MILILILCLSIRKGIIEELERRKGILPGLVLLDIEEEISLGILLKMKRELPGVLQVLPLDLVRIKK